MPAAMSTTVAPIAAMASTDDCRRMFMTLESVMNAGDWIVKKTTIASSANGTP